MRSLSNDEILSVSGAGLFSYFGSKMGGVIGTLVANHNVLNGIQDPNGITISAGEALGKGIGGIVDNIFNPFRLNKTISEMGTGIQMVKLASMMIKV
ncbi:TPA: hypothetical protein ONC18_004956 [Enterobacter kobei]|nr:hypothetical protein [Enterobacter asburiae]HCR1912157.1 hypothetical protein [Enterobacter kobei]